MFTLARDAHVRRAATASHFVQRYRVDVKEETRWFRELTDVLLLREERSLESYRPNPSEVAGLILLPLGTATKLWRGETDAVAATEWTGSRRDGRSITVGRQHFVGGTADPSYFRVLLTAVAQLQDISGR